MSSALLSVGIDVGTSTTQVVFSRLHLRDRGSRFTAPDIHITGTEVIYHSKVHITPLLDAVRIDANALRLLTEEEFRCAGIAPGDTDTGAVIITGESARKENAAAVLEQLSGLAGDFVVATAGPDLESRIAGQGSGAQEESRVRRCRVANFDIGGGTTNIAVFDCGTLVAVGCYDIGGRMLRFSSNGALTDISPGAMQAAAHCGLRLQASQVPSMDDLRKLAQAIAQILEQAILPQRASPLLHSLRTPASTALILDKPVDAVCFSGGVADCIYTAAHDNFAFGDFGVLLGRAIRMGKLFSYPVLTPKETIRATVIGAGSYTTTLSGSTIRYTNAALFPIKNLPVFALNSSQEEAAFAGRDCDIAKCLRWFLRQADVPQAAIAMQGKPSPGWQELKRMAEALANAVCAAVPPGRPGELPIILLARHDMGKALGQAIAPFAQGRPVISLDGIAAGEHHYLDIGRPVMHGQAVPVVVKTLMFG